MPQKGALATKRQKSCVCGLWLYCGCGGYGSGPSGSELDSDDGYGDDDSDSDLDPRSSDGSSKRHVTESSLGVRCKCLWSDWRRERP
jgi:hypothetical protein